MSAYFDSSVAEFLASSRDAILAALARGTADAGHDLLPTQTRAWEKQCDAMKEALQQVCSSIPKASEWGLLLEFPIPGRNKRLDIVLLTEQGVVAIEFKVGAAGFGSADKWQLQEYCWNLRDFHQASRGLKIAPILVATEAPGRRQRATPLPFADQQRLVRDLQCCNTTELAASIIDASNSMDFGTPQHVERSTWNNSLCQPTVNIIEAAQRLYESHDVREISHRYADNITATKNRLIEIISDVRANGRKAICFLTGVPGAGKTLVGLDMAYSEHLLVASNDSACFMSGNNPLLKVLRAALAKNLAATGRPKHEIDHEVSALLRNVHEFTILHLRSPDKQAPTQKILIFDEAQRAWAGSQVRKKNKEKKGFPDEYLDYSEPELILHVMERCEGWCFIIALVGGGQEINDGEAGLSEWGKALSKSKTPWLVWAPPQALKGDHSLADQKLFQSDSEHCLQVSEDAALHLSVGERSYRAKALAEWVNQVLSGQPELASETFKQIAEFPIFLTRDLATARGLLTDYCGNDRRSGLLASSGALRLRADGIELSSSFRGGYSYKDWFLSGPEDVRSSCQLEVAASEFECQGLELDWVGLCWGGDFTVNAGSTGWSYRSFKGSDWQNVRNPVKQHFLLNKYRVLLTRAREGMVIWVPRGSAIDRTNSSGSFDATASYLVACGLTELSVS